MWDLYVAVGTEVRRLRLDPSPGAPAGEAMARIDGASPVRHIQDLGQWLALHRDDGIDVVDRGLKPVRFLPGPVADVRGALGLLEADEAPAAVGLAGADVLDAGPEGAVGLEAGSGRVVLCGRGSRHVLPLVGRRPGVVLPSGGALVLAELGGGLVRLVRVDPHPDGPTVADAEVRGVPTALLVCDRRTGAATELERVVRIGVHEGPSPAASPQRTLSPGIAIEELDLRRSRVPPLRAPPPEPPRLPGVVAADDETDP